MTEEQQKTVTLDGVTHNLSDLTEQQVRLVVLLRSMSTVVLPRMCLIRRLIRLLLILLSRPRIRRLLLIGMVLMFVLVCSMFVICVRFC